MQVPLFSIIVPVYNASKYIEDCISSVLSQEMDDYELILVNDGSTDDSGNICDLFAKNYDRVKVFHKKNSGPMHTRIVGLHHAKGKYVVYLDADDYIEKKTLQYLKSCFQKHQCDCVIYGYRSIAGDKIIKTYTVNHDYLSVNKHDIYKAVFSDFAFNALVRKAYRIDAVESMDLSEYYHIHKGEDLLFSLGVLKSCKSIYFTREVLYNYRLNDESITHQKDRFTDNVDFTVSEIVYQFIMKEASFCEKEINEYRKTRYREFFIPLIKRTVLFDVPIKEKVKLFNKIRNTEYYKDFLGKKIFFSSNNITDLTIMLLFHHKHDILLIYILQIMYKIKKGVKPNE